MATAAATPQQQAMVNRISSTTSSWATPCTHWVNKGVCSRGADCYFQHQGFDTTENRCVICGDKTHRSNTCTAPGGGADPNREEAWNTYRKRKEDAKAAGKGAQNAAPPATGGDKGKGVGRGKGGRKGSKGRGQARAVLDGETLRVSSVTAQDDFLAMP